MKSVCRVLLVLGVIFAPVLPSVIGQTAKRSIPELIADLKSKDIDVRTRAAEGLAAHGPRAKAAVPVLIQALREEMARKDRIQYGRDAIILALGEIGPDARAALPLLRKLKASGYDQAIAYTILKIGTASQEEKAAIRLLLLSTRKCTPSVLLADETFIKKYPAKMTAAFGELLTDPEERCRALAASGLEILGPVASKAANALEKALGDQSNQVRLNAARALVRVMPARKTLALQTLLPLVPDPQLCHSVCEALKLFPTEAVPELIGLLRQKTGVAIWPYVRALQIIGEPAVPGLVKELTGKSVPGRINAAITLGWMYESPRQVQAALKAALKDSEEAVRLQAAVSLIRRSGKGETETIDVLTACLASRSVDTRREATQALASLGKQASSALAELRKALRDDGEIRLDAALALAAIDPSNAEAAVPVLTAALPGCSRSRGERIPQVLEALGKIGPAAAKAADRVERVMNLDLFRAQNLAAVTLHRIAPARTDRAVAALIKMVNKQGAGWITALKTLGTIGPAAKASVPHLRALLENPEIKDSYDSGTILLVLVKVDPVGSRDLLPMVRKKLTSKVRPERRRGIDMLCNLAAVDPSETVPLLIEALADDTVTSKRSRIIETLRRLGPKAEKAIPVLKKLLTARDTELTDEVREALSQIEKP